MWVSLGVLEEIIQMAKNNNGTITTAMIVKAGFSRGNLQYLVDNCLLEKSARGIYILPEMWEDEFFNLQYRFKKGIFSLESALFLWNLTDRTPNIYTMTFPATYNLTNGKLENIRCVQCKNELYAIGITQALSPSGNRLAFYNAARTLCDILKPRSSVDIQIVTDSFK